MPSTCTSGVQLFISSIRFTPSYLTMSTCTHGRECIRLPSLKSSKKPISTVINTSLGIKYPFSPHWALQEGNSSIVILLSWNFKPFGHICQKLPRNRWYHRGNHSHSSYIGSATQCSRWLMYCGAARLKVVGDFREWYHCRHLAGSLMVQILSCGIISNCSRIAWLAWFSGIQIESEVQLTSQSPKGSFQSSTYTTCMAPQLMISVSL